MTPIDIDVIVHDDPQKQPEKPKRGPILPSKHDELWGRRTGVFLRFWDSGQIWNGSEFVDLDFVASPTITPDGGALDPPGFDTVASLDSSHWDAYIAKLFEVPIEDWATTYRQITHEDGFRYGFDVYTGNPAEVGDPLTSFPNHVDNSKYYSVSSEWQRQPVDYYLQQNVVRLVDPYSAFSATMQLRASPTITLPAGTKIYFKRDLVATVTVDAVVDDVFPYTTVSITPISESLAIQQYGYPDIIPINRTAWTSRGLKVQPSDYFNLVTFNAFHNIGLHFTPHITSVNDPGASAVPFTLRRSTDFFLIPALVGNSHIGAWDSGGPLSWNRNSYLNFDFRPWSRERFLTSAYFEGTPIDPDIRSFDGFGITDTPIFARGANSFWYESSHFETVPKPTEWQTILDYYKDATDARQFKEGGGVGLTTTTDFANPPGTAPLWLGQWGSGNYFDISPKSFAYVTPGALLAVAKQGADYFYFWYTGTQKINDQYDLGNNNFRSVMQNFQVEFNQNL